MTRRFSPITRKVSFQNRVLNPTQPFPPHRNEPDNTTKGDTHTQNILLTPNRLVMPLVIHIPSRNADMITWDLFFLQSLKGRAIRSACLFVKGVAWRINGVRDRV